MSEPVWLVSDGRVLAAATRTTTRAERRRGLIGVGDVAEPLVIEPCRWVHAVGMRTAIDVAMIDASNVVVSITTLRPWRIGMPHRRAARVVEARKGSLAKWGVSVGDIVEVRRAV